MLRIYQERELLFRVRARIDQQNSAEDEETTSIAPLDDQSNRIELGGHPVNKLTYTFAKERIAVDPDARYFIRELRTFLYEEVGNLGSAFHFREKDLPRLDGTQVRILCTLVNPCSSGIYLSFHCIKSSESVMYHYSTLKAG